MSEPRRVRALAREAVRGLRLLALQDPDRPARDAASERLVVRDLRVVPLALAAWAAAWWGTGEAARTLSPAVALGLALVAGAATVALLVAPGLRAVLARRAAWLAAIALVVAVLASVGGVRAHLLHTGPVAELAAQQAAVTARVLVVGDPRLHPGVGGRPPLLTAPVRVVELGGRGRS